MTLMQGGEGAVKGTVCKRCMRLHITCKQVRGNKDEEEEGEEEVVEEGKEEVVEEGKEEVVEWRKWM